MSTSEIVARNIAAVESRSTSATLRATNFIVKHVACNIACNVEGLPGVLGNKGTLAKYQREQGNISQFLGTGEQNSKNYSTKTF